MPTTTTASTSTSRVARPPIVTRSRSSSRTLAADDACATARSSRCASLRPTTTRRSAAQGFYNYQALAAAADYVFVMGWGLHWATSAPGSIDDINWETRDHRLHRHQPNKSKFVLGHGMYGMDWPAGGGEATPGGGARVLVCRWPMAKRLGRQAGVGCDDAVTALLLHRWRRAVTTSGTRTRSR